MRVLTVNCGLACWLVNHSCRQPWYLPDCPDFHLCPVNMNDFAVSRIAMAGDHAGFGMKSELVPNLISIGLEVVDCGTHDDEPCDFPDFAEKVAGLVLSGTVERGILVCGSGVGVSVAANKIPGIRASVCHDSYSARQGVEHDDMNILCVGARVIGPSLASEIIRSYLAASYAPQPRHRRRVEKILKIERLAQQGNYRTP